MLSLAKKQVNRGAELGINVRKLADLELGKVEVKPPEEEVTMIKKNKVETEVVEKGEPDVSLSQEDEAKNYIQNLVHFLNKKKDSLKTLGSKKQSQQELIWLTRFWGAVL